MFDTLFQLQELKYLYRLYKDIKIYLHEKAGHNIIHSFFPTKMSPSPTPSPKPLSFLAPPPIRSKSASRTAYQVPKRNAITQTPALKAGKKAIPRPPPTKTKSKTLKKTIQNNPLNPTN